MATDDNRGEIEQLIKQYCKVPPPDDEFVRTLAARSRHELRSTLQEGPKTRLLGLRELSVAARRWRRAAIAAAGLAAAIIFSVLLWNRQEGVAWAQVVDAVRSKSWLRGVSDGAKQHNAHATKSEIWISMTNAVCAIRQGSRAIHDDGPTGVRLEYDPERKELYRFSGPEGTERQIRWMQTIFADLFRGREKLGQDFAGNRIAKQERQRVSDQGREWIDYSLWFEGARSTRIVFRVDPQTLLPQSMEFFDGNATQADAKPEFGYVLDYPDEGPTDIYALGVPRSAKIVDCVPKPDMARVIEGVRNSRQRFDSYYAIVAESVDAPMIDQSTKWWQSPTLHQVWSKGDCWRVEQGRPRNMHDPRFYAPAEPPADGTDKMAWWKNHLKDFDFQPSGVCDGKAIYAPKRAPPGTMETQQNTVWERWTEINSSTCKSRAASFGPAGTFMPELYAYPVGLGAPYRDTSVQLDSNPSEGPAGALLLRYRHNSNNPNVILSCRYWVDPSRSYITLRYELGEAVAPKAGPEAKWPDTYVAEEVIKTPNGLWYAPVVRRLWSGEVTSPDKRGSTVYRFFVDFKAEMPDTLFEPGSLAVKRTTTAPVSSRGTSNLRNIAIAMNRYHDSHGKFPAAYTIDKLGQPLLSWRVELLPLLGQAELYEQFHLDEPWDSEHNRTLIEKMPEVYRLPASGPYGPPGAKVKESGHTNYVVPVGKETAFPGSNAMSVSDIRDGCADTIMAVEVDDDHGVIWTKPEDRPFDAANPAEALATLPKGGFWAVLCDGSVRWIPPEFDPKYLRAAFTRAGGEAIAW